MSDKLEQKEKIEALLKQAEEGIKNVFTSDRYLQYLSMMARFHNYSCRNIALIDLQKPNATKVAGYVAWKEKFSRQVLKGEEGIQIIGYTPKKITVEQEKLDLNGNVVLGNDGKPIIEKTTKKVPSFTPVYVYDVSQTDGEPLPSLISELEGSVDGYNNLLYSLTEVSPFPVEFKQFNDSKKGFCDPLNQVIVIKDGMSEAQTIKTIIHEITHAELHAPELGLPLADKTDKRTKEVEAESTAFVVCNHFGIDTSDYSFGYLANWSSNKELKELQNSLEKIQKQASGMIDKIEYTMQELQKAPLTQEVDYSIYQLKQMEKTRGLLFAAFSEVDNGLPNADLYEKVYSGNVSKKITRKGSELDFLFEKFNTDLPSDFRGHILSMSDIIVREINGNVTAHYVDLIGFVEVPDFVNQLKFKEQLSVIDDKKSIVDKINLAKEVSSALAEEQSNKEQQQNSYEVKNEKG